MFKHDATYERGDLTTDSDCRSQGDNRTEALSNIREAIETYLKSLRKHGDPVPPSIFEEVIEVAGSLGRAKRDGVPGQPLRRWLGWRWRGGAAARSGVDRGGEQ